MEKKELELLHNAGVGKGLDHQFVYRYPDSKDMPVVQADEFQEDLSGGKRKAVELAFYVHIPFCTSICGYCHYFKQLVPGKANVERYGAALRKEAASYKKLVGGEVEANSLLFGGGTPTALEAESLNELAGFLREFFGIGKGIEASLESSPETLSLEKLSLDCRNGIDKGKFKRIFGKCFGECFGKAVQELDGLGLVEELDLESVTASDLRVQKGTAFFEMDRAEFSSEEELIEMHSTFVEKMSGLGYGQAFPYQFVKRGREMHFLMNQWHNKEFLGLGASSCSYLGGWDWNNLFPTEAYESAVEEQGVACAVGLQEWN